MNDSSIIRRESSGSTFISLAEPDSDFCACHEFLHQRIIAHHQVGEAKGHVSSSEDPPLAVKPCHDDARDVAQCIGGFILVARGALVGLCGCGFLCRFFDSCLDRFRGGGGGWCLLVCGRRFNRCRVCCWFCYRFGRRFCHWFGRRFCRLGQISACGRRRFCCRFCFHWIGRGFLLRLFCVGFLPCLFCAGCLRGTCHFLFFLRDACHFLLCDGACIDD